jgi:hypothetical protein
MSGNKRREAKGEMFVMMLDGEQLELMEKGYEIIRKVFEEHDQEPPTFDKFLKDSMSVGCKHILSELMNDMQKAVILEHLHRMGLI